MVVGKAPLATITNGLDVIVPAETRTVSARSPNVVTIPVKRSETSLSTSTCSVATEQCFLESRDAATPLSRGDDDGRDVVQDTAISKAETAPVLSLVAPAPITEERVNFDSRNLLTGTGDNLDSAIQSFYSNAPDVGNPATNTGIVPIDKRNLLIRTGDNIDSAVHRFYSNLEVGAVKVWGAVTCSSSSVDRRMAINESSPDAEGLLTNTSGECIVENVNSQDTMNSVNTLGSINFDKTQGTGKTQGSTKSVKTQGTIESIKTQDSVKSIKSQGTVQSNKTLSTHNSVKYESETLSVQPSRAKSGCCATSMFGCSVQGDDELESVSIELLPMNLDEIMKDSINIPSDQPHLLDTFSADDTIESDERSQRALEFVTPKAQLLLNEIENIENNLYEVRRSASIENIDQIKKRQDPFIKKMASIKQLLLEQHALLQAAPAETKEDYYRAISRAAVLSAEVETRRAELELKKIKLETMKIEDEMACLTFSNSLDDTFYSTDDTLMSKESMDGFHRAFDVFAKYTAYKFHKMRKNRTKGRELSR